MAERFDVALVGGDTNAWDGPLVIAVTLLGETTERGAVRRSGAQVGDAIVVTGPLGGSLLGQQKYADAEPLLLAGYEGMKSRENKIPAESWSQLTKACQRVAQLYDVTGRKEKANEWRARLQLSR